MEKNNTLRADITTTQSLLAAPLDYTTSINRKFKLSSITFHFGAGVTEVITITKDSVQGADYDIVLKSISLSGGTSYIFRPESDEDFQEGDEVRIQCTNVTAVTDVFCVIKTRELE